MQFKNVVSAMGYCLRQPRSSFRSFLRLSEFDRANELAGRFGALAARLSPDSRPDPRFDGVQNPLWDYFESHRAGQGIWKWTHYFEIYQRHLSKFVGRSPHVVEIGIYSGGSLPMWRPYFGPGCHVSGIDIQEECKTYADSDVSIHIGDQADRGFWKKFRESSPGVDVLIDDGGHLAEQQSVTLEEMLPYLKPGGVYLCEDICGVNNAFAEFVHRVADRLNALHGAQTQKIDGGTAFTTTPFQQMVHSVHIYPFVVVIERTDHPVSCLRDVKHGTEWQPFL
jgi:hypothetical protein